LRAPAVAVSAIQSNPVIMKDPGASSPADPS
jgi:hypothetical protein